MCGKTTALLGVVNIFLNGKLHGLYYKVRAVWNASSIVVRNEVVGNFLVKCACNVAGNDMLDCSGNPDGS